MGRGDRVRVNGESTPGGLRYTVKGSEMNSTMAIHNMGFLPLSAKADSLMIGIYDAYAKPESEQDEEQIDGLYAERGEYIGEMAAVRTEYIRNNPGKELSAFYLRYAGDSTEHYLALLTPFATGGLAKPYIETLEKRLAELEAQKKAKESIVEGAPAPAFSLADRGGNMVSPLTDIKTGYIVLDFWGSWCGWCIKGFPKMKEYYAKYKGKVEFVGIDCRDTREQWIAALDQYELPWTQLFDNVDDKTAVKYAVEGYPTKILIGPDRTIISIFLGEVEEFYQKLDELLK